MLTSVVEPERGIVTFGYDAVGNRISKQVGSAHKTSYDYDGQNRLLLIDYPGNTPDVEYGYDGNDNTTFIDNGYSRIEYEYDVNNNIVSELLFLDNKAFRVEYNYTLTDQLKSIAYPSGQIVWYNPNALNQSTADSPFVTDVTYFPTGQEENLTYNNGFIARNVLDDRKLIWKRSISNGPTKTFNYEYQYDTAGNLTNLDNKIDSTLDRILYFDKQNRLTRVEHPINKSSQFMEFDYDTVSNIKYMNRSDASGTYNLNYGYSLNNTLSTVSGYLNYSLNYDTYGNISALDQNNTFFYDDAGNLRTASTNTININYMYNGKNRLIREYKNNSYIYTIYLKNEDTVLEYSPDDDWLKERYYLNSKVVAD